MTSSINRRKTSSEIEFGDGVVPQRSTRYSTGLRARLRPSLDDAIGEEQDAVAWLELFGGHLLALAAVVER